MPAFHGNSGKHVKARAVSGTAETGNAPADHKSVSEMTLDAGLADTSLASPPVAADYRVSAGRRTRPVPSVGTRDVACRLGTRVVL